MCIFQMTNNKGIEDLTSRLCEALDPNYDVVNMETVLSVISTLEGALITKEQLETTRLAKYINQLRRRTKNESLARRAKTLLKKWREMVGIQQVSNDSCVPLFTSNKNVQLKNKSDHGNVQNPNCEFPDSATNSAFVHNFSKKIPTVSPFGSKEEKQDKCNPFHKKNVYTNEKRPSLNFTNMLPVSSNSFNFKNIADKKEFRDSFNIEQSSNSSNEVKINISENVNVEPIVIDIQDSDSDTSIKNCNSTLHASNQIAENKISALSEKNNNKQRKIKKDKKRKERRSSVKNDHVNLADSNSSQPSLSQDARIYSHPIGNISEILALSNSSTNPFFNVEQSKMKEDLKHELSFAGKFQNNLITKTSMPEANNEDNFLLEEKSIYKEPILSDFSINNFSDSSLSLMSKNEVAQFGMSLTSEKKLVEHKQTPIKDSKKSEAPFVAEITFQKIETQDKTPKKRGRKRGSKGVDSIIAKETNFSSQMIMSSIGNGGKKVKTTKELYAEMQNKKISEDSQNVSIKTSSQSLGSCSGNEDSNSISNASDQSQQSFNSNKRLISIDSSSESHLGNMSFEREKNDDIYLENSNYVIKEMQNELIELLKRLTEPRSIKQIQEDCKSKEVSCTCQVIKTKDEQIELESDNGVTMNNELLQNGIVKIESTLVENIHLKESLQENEMPPNIVKTTPEVESIKKKQTTVKSIFDLDFDESDDPLNFIRAEAETADIPNNEEVKNDLKENTYLHSSSSFYRSKNVPQTDVTQKSSQLCNVDQLILNEYKPNQLYFIEEDPLCEAKQYYLDRICKITQFHINLLHNFFIPNINGNINHSTESRIRSDKKINEEEEVVEIEDVVPKYGSFDGETLQKNHSSFVFSTNFEFEKRKRFSNNYRLPFLGVAFPLVHKSALFYNNKFENRDIEKAESVLNPELKSNLSAEKLLHNNEFKNENIVGKSLNALRSFHEESDVSSNEKDSEMRKILFPLDKHLNNLNIKELDNEKDEENISSRRNSSSSSSSLKTTQKSINLKIKKLNFKYDSQKQKTSKTKRKRKKVSKKPIIKKLKIAINGDIATQCHVPIHDIKNSTDEDYQNDTENDYSSLSSNSNSPRKGEDEYSENGENISPSAQFNNQAHINDGYPTDFYHQVFTKTSANDNNHIVLTIKKNLSLSNCNKSSEIETSISLQATNRIEQCADPSMPAKEQYKDETAQINNETIFHDNKYKENSLKFVKTSKRKHKNTCIAKTKENSLFHSDELYVISKDGTQKEFIFNINNCSSSCDENEEEPDQNGYNYSKMIERNHFETNDSFENDHVQFFDETVYDSIDVNQVEHLSKVNLPLLDNQSEPYKPDDHNKEIDEIPVENNDLLESFNNICSQSSFSNGTLSLDQTKLCRDEKASQNGKLESNTMHNKTKVTMGDNNEKFLLDSGSISNCAHSSFENEGNSETNCSHNQNFKEWHQVLQLRSYNDELLTVLPYVVLE